VVRGGVEPPTFRFQIVEAEAGHADLAACAGESLANGVTAHGLAVATDQHAVWPGPLSHVSGEDGQHVRRNGDSAFASVRLGWSVEGFPRGEEFGAVRSDGDRSGFRVNVLRRQRDDLATAGAAPRTEQDGSAVPGRYV